MAKKLLLLGALLFQLNFQIYSQKHVFVGNILAFYADFRTSTCITAYPHTLQEYAKTGNEKEELYVVDSTSLNVLYDYIIKNGKLLSFDSDGGNVAIYQVIINTNDTIELYFQFYKNEEVYIFYESLIRYLKFKNNNNSIIPILSNEMNRYRY